MELFYIFLIILIGSIIQGATSFGFAIVSMPFLVLFLPVKTATILVLILAAFLVFFIFIKMRKHVSYQAIIYVIIGSYIGVAVGVFGLENLETNILQSILGVLLILVSIYFFFNKDINIKPTKTNGLFSGLISGLFGGLFNITGPPLVIYYFSSIENKKEYQGTIQATFFFSILFTMAIHLFRGNITFEILKMASVGLTAVILGSIIGLKIFDHLDKRLIKKILSVVMIIMGSMLIF
jgi:hypothetical protein